MGHLDPFKDEIKAVGSKLTSVTLQLYNKIISKLPPTPSKFHYIFNLRDLSRIYEGLCTAVVDCFDSAAAFVRLWRNEALRIFHDRLISNEDKAIVSGAIAELIQDNFAKESGSAMVEPILFGDFKNLADENSPRLNQDIGTYDDVKMVFEEVLVNYNTTNKPMNLVLFDDALEHLTRIHRILRLPRGNALLVGVGGSGKQSLSR